MAESDLVENLTEDEKANNNEISKKEEPQTYTQIFSQIITDFSDFLSKRSVYEAAPENSKVLVFNSDLSFKEMIKAFINEDIYCALIYDSKKEFFIGIITISDILFLFEYIIEKAQERIIGNYDNFIKEIFNTNKILVTEEEEDSKENNDNQKNKNFDILKHLTKINYNDYFEVIKKYKKIHILYSISLDSSLLDVLKVIKKVGVHRLVVEETKKKGIENKKRESEINIQNTTFDNKTDKEKTEKSNKDKSETEKSEVEKSDKKIKKVKTKKKVSENEENKDKEKEGEKVVKKKVKKIKKKKTEAEIEEKDKEKVKEKEDNENKEEGGEKVVKKKVKKIKKKKTETDLNEKDKDKETKEKKEEDKKSEDKKETNNFQKSEKSVIEIEDNSNKEVLKLNPEETNKNSEAPSETQNYTGFVTYETVFDFLIYNYYSMEMAEFNLTLEDLKKLPLNSSFIKPLNNFALINEQVHSSFSKNVTSKKDILPILTEDKQEVYGFLYLRDYLYFVSNCESNQNLTNEQFLKNMYEGIESEIPYGKERIIYFEYNQESKKYRIKQLLECINGAPEKKIVLKDIEDGNKLYVISLKSIFDVVVEMNDK